MRFAQGKATDVDKTLISRSDGATTVLTAIEGNDKAWDKIKEAAGKELRSEAPIQNAEYGVRNSTIPPTQQAGETMWVQGEAVMELDKSVRNTIENFAKRTGSTVIVEHGLVDENGKAIMGEEKDGVIKINADYADVAHSIAVHEFTHRMQNIAPKASEKFRNYVVAKMKNEGTYEEAMAKLREDYQGLSDEKLIDELCAETAERLFDNEVELTDFIKKDRTMAERVKDAWLKVLDMLGRTDEKTHAQFLWKKCVKEATKGKDKDSKSSEVRYKKEYSFNKQVDDALDNKMKSGYSVYVGRLPNLLTKCGLNPDLVMLMNQGHLRDVEHKKDGIHREYHEIPRDIIKQVPELLKRPALIYDSISEENKENSVCILTTKCDKDGNPIIIIIENSDRGGSYLNLKMEIVKVKASNYVKSLYGREGFFSHMGDVINNDSVLYSSKNGMEKLFAEMDRVNQKNKKPKLNSDSKLELLARLDNLGFDTIIHQSRNVVNSKSMQNGENNSASVYKRPGVSEKLNEYTDFETTTLTTASDLSSPAGENIDPATEDTSQRFIKPGAEPRRDVKVPESVEENTKVRQFARTAAEAETLTDKTAEGVLENVEEGKFNYTPISNKSAMKNAYASLDTMGIEWVEKKVNGAISSHKLDKNTVAMAEVLLEKYSQEGQEEKAQRLIIDFAAESTRTAQILQAISMLKKLDPNYEVAYIDKIVENLREEIIERNNKKFGKKHSTDIEVSEELKTKLMEAKTEEEREAIRDEIYTEIADQLPNTWINKWNAWRYMAMLGNARTHVRNVVGNAFFMPMIATKNTAAKFVEPIVAKATGGKIERSKTFIVPKKYRQFATEDVEAMRKELQGGGKHNPSDEKENITLFDNHFGKKCYVLFFTLNYNSRILNGCFLYILLEYVLSFF